MKHLLLFAILVTTSAFSADGKEMKAVTLTDQELKKKFVAVIKDKEVENLIDKSSEFKECKDKAKKKDIPGAEACFKDKISKKGKGEIEKLASSLDLQSHGVIKSKDTKEITNYLSDRLYKVMTGVDRNEANKKKLLESMKFKNRKMVDQKDFIDLYSTQLGKNALFEISRFCFENFRHADKVDKKDFVTYWASFFDGAFPSNSQFRDDGESGDFVEKFSDTSSKEKIYEDIFKGISSAKTPINAAKMGEFFHFCSEQILPLCELYRKDTTKEIGANACITEGKLQEIRKAISNTAKVSEQFDKMSSTDAGFILDAKHFDRGNRNEEESIDNLTNFSSADFLTDKQDDLTKKCSEKAESPECEGFLVVSDDGEKAKERIDVDMRLKKQLEIQRIIKLKNEDQKSVEKYLEDNGYFALATEVKANGPAALTEKMIEDQIGLIFEGRRAAILQEMDNSVGKRQMTQEKLDESLKLGGDKKEFERVNAETSLSERARLAQVILFNNIITSNLKLTDAKTKKDVGRNANAWMKEQKGLESAKIDYSLFSGLKQAAESSGRPSTKDNSIVGIGMLDGILGKPNSDKD